jgi:hypothetical protein
MVDYWTGSFLRPPRCMVHQRLDTRRIARIMVDVLGCWDWVLFTTLPYRKSLHVYFILKQKNTCHKVHLCLREGKSQKET